MIIKIEKIIYNINRPDQSKEIGWMLYEQGNLTKPLVIINDYNMKQIVKEYEEQN